MALEQQDVVVDYDAQGHITVDRYARALEILDGNNQDCWQYEMHELDGVVVHYANLIGDLRLEVRVTQALNELNSMATYTMYFDAEMAQDAVGFNHPIWFEFTDNHGVQTTFPYNLQRGDNMVHVGQFSANPIGFLNVSLRVYDNTTHMKKGLTVRRVRITTA